MKTIKNLCIATCIAISSVSFAQGICDGFIVSLKNTLPDEFIIRTIHINGATLEPGHIDILKGKTEQKLTVNNASKDDRMEGKITLNSLSLPTKEIRIRFYLSDKGLYCQHTDNNSQGDHPVEKNRDFGGVTYKIIQ